jgi:rubrerythrin
MARTLTPPRDTASTRWRNVLFGGGSFDVSGEHPNRRGWELFELGQRTFWDVPTAVAWDEPVREDPRYAEAIAAMLGFLCPGEKMAVTGASCISLLVPSEEAKFYFAEQALEEAKHYDALRRIIPKITGRPLDAPKASVRMLFSFGVIDPADVAFMMGNINIIGEHLANQIFNKIKPVARSEAVLHLLELISRDESRHIAAGRRFFGEVYDQYRKSRRKIMAKNLMTTILLGVAAADLVNPMKALEIDLAQIMDKMYDHYEDVVGGVPPFPEQAILDAVVDHLRKSTPKGLRVLSAMTGPRGDLDLPRMLRACEQALRSPRALRAIFA